MQMDIYNFLLVFHIFVVGLLFLYIGIYKEKIDVKLYDYIYYLAIIIILYHSYKVYIQKDTWVNYIHILFIGPLLLTIGKNNIQTPYYYYEMLLILGFGAIGFNSYKFLLYNDLLVN